MIAIHAKVRGSSEPLVTADRYIAQELGLTHKSVGMIRRGGYCGERTRKKLAALYRKVTGDKPKLTGQLVYCGQMTPEQKELINMSLSTEERSAILIKAAMEKDKLSMREK